MVRTQKRCFALVLLASFAYRRAIAPEAQQRKRVLMARWQKRGIAPSRLACMRAPVAPSRSTGRGKKVH